MLVWGGHALLDPGGDARAQGQVRDGASYDPVSDTWQPLSLLGAPTPRTEHTAVWTGSQMLVWGGFGFDEGGPLATGARYDPVTDTWRPLSTADAPQDRYAHLAVWTEREMVIWAGKGGLGVLNAEGGWELVDGGRYDPATDTWRPTSSAEEVLSEPPGGSNMGRAYAAVWTGQDVLVWGGRTDAQGARYDPMTDIWRPLASEGAPSQRADFTAVWTGRELIIWGGAVFAPRGGLVFGDGGRYSLLHDAWNPIQSRDQPTARRGHSASWTRHGMIVWGGAGNGFLADGWRYAPPRIVTSAPETCPIADLCVAVH
jgi:hypothetical protein